MKDKEANLYKWILGVVYVFFALMLNSYNPFGIYTSLILIMICTYLQELTIYKLKYDNYYSNKFDFSILRSVVYISEFLLIDYIYNNKFSGKNMIMVCTVVIFSYFFCPLTMKFEVKYRTKKYHSFFIESKYWKKRSENFKWNYSDLRKVAYRGSEIVCWIIVAYLVVCFTVIGSVWYSMIYILLFISLYHLEYQAMMDRTADIITFKKKKYSNRDILKIISTQFIWMILRGVSIGVIVSCIILYVRNEDVFIAKLLSEVVAIALISYGALSLAVCRYLTINPVK